MWNPDLQCHLEHAEEVPGGGHVRLWIGPYECVDMSGAIRYCVRRWPRVRFIQTIAGAQLDTAYRRRDTGRWIAELLRERTTVAPVVVA